MDDIVSTQIQVSGHEWAVDLLKKQERAERVPQSLLFSGPPNVGKATLARFFAQYLNCQGETRPCGHCLACRKINSGNHPDVRFLDDEGTLKIDEIRELQRDLSLSPYEGRYRVAMLCNFERATTSAANALLKTLEEPAEQVVLILTAIDPGGLLPTIVSRCQVLALRGLPLAQVSEALQQRWQATPEQANLLAQLSAGRLGWAIRAIQDEAVLEYRQSCLGDMFDLLAMNRVDRLAYAQTLSRNPTVIRETLLLWLSLWRDLLLLHSGSQTKLLNLDWIESLERISRRGDILQAKAMVERLRTAILNLDHNVNARLNLENVLLKMPTYQ